MASKEYAEYRDRPKGSQQCSGCSMFRAPQACTLVEGKISPRGWCRYWEKKEKGNG